MDDLHVCETVRSAGACLAAVTSASPASAAPGGVLIYGLTTADSIVQFRAGSPDETIGELREITVLGADEDVVGIDVRPLNGSFYGVVNNTGASGDRLIVINPDSGTVMTSFSLRTQLDAAPSASTSTRSATSCASSATRTRASTSPRTPAWSPAKVT